MDGDVEFGLALAMEIGARLRLARRSADLTQEEAAVAGGISARSYKDYEAGRRLPPVDVIVRLAAAWRVSLDRLLIGARSGQGGEAEARLVREVAAAVLAVYSETVTDGEAERRLRLVEYAFGNARAKSASLEEELKQVVALSG